MNPNSKAIGTNLVQKIFEYKACYPIVELYVSRNVKEESEDGQRLKLRAYTENSKMELYVTTVLPDLDEVLDVVYVVMTHLDKMPTDSEHSSEMNDIVETGFMFF